MEDEALPFFTSKWIWMVLLSAVLFGVAGFYILTHNGNSEKVKPLRTKSKIKARKVSKK